MHYNVMWMLGALMLARSCSDVEYIYTQEQSCMVMYSVEVFNSQSEVR